MPENTIPIARGPIRQTGRTAVVDGWEVSTDRTDAPLRLQDLSALSKVVVRVSPGGEASGVIGVGLGEVRRNERGTLVVGSGPLEWMLLGPPGSAGGMTAWVLSLGSKQRLSAVDVSHGRALMRVSGTDSARTLAKLCAIDLADHVTPNASAFRSSVAKLATDVIRDDIEGQTSYLVHCERSSGQYLFDVLLDAGREFEIEQDGYVW